MPFTVNGTSITRNRSGPSTKNGRGDRSTPTARATSQIASTRNTCDEDRQREHPGEEPRRASGSRDPFVGGPERALELEERSTGASSRAVGASS